MRVPNKTLYGASQYQLNDITNKLKDANEVVSTQKRINALSDDPIGLSQVLNLELLSDNLVQFERNIEVGRTWLTNCEKSLGSVNEQLLKAKNLCIRLANASFSASERQDAIEAVDGMINQIISLGNININGSYLFSGTKTNVRPFDFDDVNTPTKVIYNGNDDAFSIKTGMINKLDVGRNGKKVFSEEKIKIDKTNNKIVFKEDIGLGLNYSIVLEASIKEGEYSHDDITIAIRNAMEEVSFEKGNKINYEVSYDSKEKKFHISDDGAYEGYFKFELLWESGSNARIDNVLTGNIDRKNIDIKIVNAANLKIQTDTSGIKPLMFVKQTDGTWKVKNDPGYSLPAILPANNNKIKLDLSKNGSTDIEIDINGVMQKGDYLQFDIVTASKNNTIGADLGFTNKDISLAPLESNSKVIIKTFDTTNNVIDFKENIGSGLSNQLTASIPVGKYYDMGTLSNAIEEAMQKASANSVDYEVSYDKESGKFTVKGESKLTQLDLLWNTGTHKNISSAKELGFNIALDSTGKTLYKSDNKVVLFSIVAGKNDSIDFQEIMPDSKEKSELTALIPAGDYSDPDDLAKVIEKTMENESAKNGYRVDYDVSYSYISNKFSIKEDGDLGKKLEEVKILWQTGANKENNAASVLGFDKKDIVMSTIESEEVSWGVFETLFALKDYLSKDDVDGISRTMTRLDTHYNSIVSTKSDTGIKFNRLEIRKQVTTEIRSTLTERKSFIEDADIVKSVMDIKSIQTAYEASLGSTARVINVSLIDYI